MFLDGNRTRIFPRSWETLTPLSYQSDNRSTAAHPKTATDKERTGIPATGWLGRDLNPLAVSRVADNPDSTARRKTRWTSDVIDRRHSVPGIEPGPLALSPETVRPPLWR